jgi:hypothetical protein
VGCVCLLCTDTSNPLGTLLHLLRSPSRAVQERGEAVLQQNYHMRPPGTLEVNSVRYLTHCLHCGMWRLASLATNCCWVILHM